MEADAHDLTGTVTVVEKDKGSGTLFECSRRGVCDRLTGLCQCSPGWFSSDGAGRKGARGDCGWFDTAAMKSSG
jgi:hypothetical protein